MSVKDKIILLLMVLLLVGGVYVYYTYTLVMDRMDLMDKQQFTHIDQVNKEFRDGLNKLDLQFIGRGKHLQTAQQDIVANTALINNVNENLISKIEDVSYDLDEAVREINNEISSLNRELGDLRADVDSERRRNSRRLTDIEQSITNVKNSIKELDDLSIIQKAREKK
jgi:chromosome segregation ATPase